MIEHIFEPLAFFLPVRTFLTSSRARGARRAGAGRCTGIAPREATADCKAAQHPPAAGWPPEGTVQRRAPAAFLWPFGPRLAGAHSPPRPTAWATRRNVSGGARGHGAGHPSGARIMKPCKIAVQSARCARVAARSLGTLDSES